MVTNDMNDFIDYYDRKFLESESKSLISFSELLNDMKENPNEEEIKNKKKILVEDVSLFNAEEARKITNEVIEKRKKDIIKNENQYIYIINKVNKAAWDGKNEIMFYSEISDYGYKLLIKNGFTVEVHPFNKLINRIVW
jgi:uncharacterized membrane protein